MVDSGEEMDLVEVDVEVVGSPTPLQELFANAKRHSGEATKGGKGEGNTEERVVVVLSSDDEDETLARTNTMTKRKRQRDERD